MGAGAEAQVQEQEHERGGKEQGAGREAAHAFICKARQGEGPFKFVPCRLSLA